MRAAIFASRRRVSQAVLDLGVRIGALDAYGWHVYRDGDDAVRARITYAVRGGGEVLDAGGTST